MAQRHGRCEQVLLNLCYHFIAWFIYRGGSKQTRASIPSLQSVNSLLIKYFNEGVTYSDYYTQKKTMLCFIESNLRNDQ